MIIKGQGPLGDNAIRCVYMVEGATLEGVTLTNGFTRMAGDMDTERSGGGLYAPTSSGTIISNCVLAGNFARQDGGGAFRGTLYGCVVADNTADSDDGGGVAHCTLYDCIVRDNSAPDEGGGIYISTATRCEIFRNECPQGGGIFYSDVTACNIYSNTGSWGGGARTSTLRDCLLYGNTALSGGGAMASNLIQCTVVSNSATGGGGAQTSSLRDCLVYGNTATTGGGAHNSWLGNCTVVSNSATGNGGGVYNADAWNCIVWGNSAADGDNWYVPFGSPDISHSCTTPMPEGDGNITNNPAFVDAPNGDYRISVSSPCFNAGSNGVVTTSVDLDGNPRIAGPLVDMGAYEEPATTRYVDDDSTDPQSPYTNAAHAATNIQAAIDVSVANDLILVSAGMYDSGTRIVDGSMKNRVVIDRPITVRGVDGRDVTIIKGVGPWGDSAVRCVWLGADAVSKGSRSPTGTLERRVLKLAEQSGGGVYCAASSSIVSNCVIVGLCGL